MKKGIIIYAIAALFAVLNTSCQKDSLVEQRRQENVKSHSVIVYYVDNVRYEDFLNNDMNVELLMRHLITMAHEGSVVIVVKDEYWRQRHTKKEIIEYVTSSQTDAENWATKMVLGGYIVTIKYDKDAQSYICTARR